VGNTPNYLSHHLRVAGNPNNTSFKDGLGVSGWQFPVERSWIEKQKRNL